jgi:hypothetical protein
MAMNVLREGDAIEAEANTLVSVRIVLPKARTGETPVVDGPPRVILNPRIVSGERKHLDPVPQPSLSIARIDVPKKSSEPLCVAEEVVVRTHITADGRHPRLRLARVTHPRQRVHPERSRSEDLF